MNMTLVQASIANNGETIIIIADRLLTREFGEEFPPYEFEGNTPKIGFFYPIFKATLPYLKSDEGKSESEYEITFEKGF